MKRVKGRSAFYAMITHWKLVSFRTDGVQLDLTFAFNREKGHLKRKKLAGIE